MKRYEFGMTLILSIVTCGIYMIIVFADMAKNLNTLDQSGDKDLMNGYLALLVLGPVTCGIFVFVYYYQFFAKLVKVSAAKGIKVEPSDNPIVLLLIMCVPVYSFYVLCNAYNNVIA